MKNYNVEVIDGTTIIWYEESGRRISFIEAEDNSDYQAYLRWLENPDADESGTL